MLLQTREQVKNGHTSEIKVEDPHTLKSLLIKKRDLSVCLSGYTFRHVLMSHADILDIDRGHISRKHRHKNNKNVAVIYEKTVKKNQPLPGYLPASCHGACALKVQFPTCVVRTHTYLTRKTIMHSHIFNAEGFACKRSGGLPLGRWPCMIGLRVSEIDETGRDRWGKTNKLYKLKTRIISRKLDYTFMVDIKYRQTWLWSILK